jgi:hypothetical protein
MQVSVNSVNDLSSAAQGIMHCNYEIHERCKERIAHIEHLLVETENEERFSNGLLQAAKVAESAAFAVLVAAELRLAQALASEAAAIASANPIAIAAAAVDVIQATQAFNQAKNVYDIAKRHRELMERRYEMAVQCLNLTKVTLEKTRGEFNFLLLTVTEASHRGASRISAAVRDITKYLAERQPEALRYLKANANKRNYDKRRLGSDKIDIEDGDLEFEKWKEYEPKDREPVKPDEINNRLKLTPEMMKALLAYLCAGDQKFRTLVDRYRAEAREFGKRIEVEKKIRVHIVGRLGEEIVLHALKPYGEAASTQDRFITEDGRHTKIDLIIKKLKVPMILSFGKGNAAREGQDLAVEVKCGAPEYLTSQLEHLLFQAKGHVLGAASCVICTRDIKNIADSDQKLLRGKLREAGSPMLGMLPYKAELDRVCYEFVFGE